MPATKTRAFAPLRRLAHLLVVAGGWVGFVWLWRLVAARPWESQGLMWLILGSLLLAPLLTGLWVLHNRSLYRRKGERRGVAAADMRYARDWHGREVRADWGTLRRSAMVWIRVEGDRKIYQGSRADPSARGEPQLPPASESPMPAAEQPLQPAAAPHTPLR